MAGPTEILGWRRAGWRRGPCRRRASPEPRRQRERLSAALQHWGASHSTRVAHGPGPGLCPVHHRVYDGHRPAEDDVCDCHPQNALQERGVQGGDQPVHEGACLYTGSTKGEGTSPMKCITFIIWRITPLTVRFCFVFFPTKGSVKLHCQRSPLLYADRQPDMKSDVTGFNEILLEKTL